MSGSPRALSRRLRWFAVGMALLAAFTAALEIWLISDLERLTQQTELALRTPATDAQALRSLAASALDGAQGMSRAAVAALLIAIGACALSAVVLFAAAREAGRFDAAGAADLPVDH